MKRHTDRRRTAAPRPPREIRVRMPNARPAASPSVPDVWVVNGRVIRFLDPSRPEDPPAKRPRRRPLAGLLRALRPHRRQRVVA